MAANGVTIQITSGKSLGNVRSLASQARADSPPAADALVNLQTQLDQLRKSLAVTLTSSAVTTDSSDVTIRGTQVTY